MYKKEFGTVGEYGFKFEVIDKQLIIINNGNKHRLILDEKQIKSLQEAINYALDMEGEQ